MQGQRSGYIQISSVGRRRRRSSVTRQRHLIPLDREHIGAVADAVPVDSELVEDRQQQI